MGRGATKTAGNFISFAANAIPAKLNGASQLSVSSWFMLDGQTPSASANSNPIMYLHFSAAALNALVELWLDFAASPFTVGVFFRSSSTADSGILKATTPVALSTAVLPVGVWWHVGASVNYITKTMKIYLNGRQEATGQGTFASTSVVTATPSVADGFGFDPGQAGTSVSFIFPGATAEHAIWTTDIGERGFQDLAKGIKPTTIDPNKLAVYVPYAGGASPELEVMNGFAGTINGTVGVTTHPPANRSSGSQHFTMRRMGGMMQPVEIFY